MDPLGSHAAGARRRYQNAFFALGWLLLIGILFHAGAARLMRDAYSSAEEGLAGMAQRMSDTEGTASPRAHHGSRREQLASTMPALQSQPFLAKPDRLLYGVFDGDFPTSFTSLAQLESRTHYLYPIISVYQRKDEARFPLRLADTIDRLGSVPMVTWEPEIARGDYDFYVTKWASEAAKFGKPIYLRFAPTMNGNRPADFIAAWKHVHLVFQKMNATNVLWVWSPQVSTPGFEDDYPGPEWVDWIGTGVLTSHWLTFDQILEKAYPTLKSLNKPIMITEFGTLTSGGDAVQWYRGAFHDLHEKYGGIRAVIFFNQTRWSPLQSAGAMVIVRNELARK